MADEEAWYDPFKRLFAGIGAGIPQNDGPEKPIINVDRWAGKGGVLEWAGYGPDSAEGRLTGAVHAPGANLPKRHTAIRSRSKFGFEGVVSKRLASRYSGGPSRNWIKTKCPDWKRINAERHKLFEGPRKPELTEAQKTLAKKREELARVRERLQAPDLRPGIARELRKHVTILEREIAELDQA